MTTIKKEKNQDTKLWEEHDALYLDPAEDDPADTEPEEPKRKKREKKKGRGILAVVLVLLILAVGAVGAAAWFSYRTMQVDTVFPGVSAAGLDFSGMSREEVNAALMAQGAARYEGFSVTASLPMENSLTITAEEAGVTWNADALTEEIWSYGRSGTMTENTITYLKAEYLDVNTFHTDTGLSYALDEEAVRALISQAAEDINAQLLESGVEINDHEIRLLKGAAGMTLDEELVFSQFRDAFLTANNAGFSYEAAPQPDEEYDFQTLHDSLYAEMANARIVYAPSFAEGYAELPEAPETPEIVNYAWGNDAVDRKSLPALYRPAYTDPQPGDEALDFGGEPFIVTESRTGVDFDVESAQAAWAAAGYGDTVLVPLTVTEPSVTTEEITSKLFADPLSKNWTMVRLWNSDYCDEVRTSLSGSSKDRISNVKKACEILDGMMLMPGEIFDYNAALGERTEENGWLPATAYADGEVRQEFGGGICQVSSTLYNAVAYANLRVLERECHQFQVGYLPAGMDATVSWGWPNFRFINTKIYPIKLHAWVDESTNECCVQILGTDYEHVYVLMRFNKWTTYDETGEYVDEEGNAKAIGTEAATWRTIYEDGVDWATGKPISDCYEYYSKYHYHTEDI